MTKVWKVESDPTFRKSSLTRLSLLVLALLAAPSFAFDLEGHRGTRGLAPENTLAAFRKALSIGVTTIETDMGVTKDDAHHMGRKAKIAEQCRHCPAQVVSVPSRRAGEPMQPFRLPIPITQDAATFRWKNECIRFGRLIGIATDGP